MQKAELTAFENSQGEKLAFFLLQLFVFALPFNIFYSNLALITFFAVTLLQLSRQRLSQIPRKFWLFQIPFFLAVGGYFYSLHRDVAAFLIERQLAIFLLPLFLPLAFDFKKGMDRKLLLSLSLACLLAICVLFFRAFMVIKENDLPVLQTLFSGAFFNHEFSKPLNIHAGYLSLYVSFSILFLAHELAGVKTLYSGLFLCIALLLLFAGLFFLASRNALIATFAILAFILPIFKVRRKWRYFLISTCVLVASVLLIQNVPYLKYRFSVELVGDIRSENTSMNFRYNAAEPRIERWKGALRLWEKSPVIGFGTGDEVAMLRTEYIRNAHYLSYLENFNAHNQYLSYLLKNGLLGLSIVLAVFLYYLFLAFSVRNYLYVSFLVLLLIGFYTENILDANKGIYFFAFFNTFFGFSILKLDLPFKSAQQQESGPLNTN